MLGRVFNMDGLFEGVESRGAAEPIWLGLQGTLPNQGVPPT